MDIPSYYHLNKERIAPRKAAWRAANRDKTRAANQRHYQKNKESILQKKKDYYKLGYYLNKLKSKFEVLRGEILNGNDSPELLEDFGELIDEMLNHNLISEEEYQNLSELL